MKAEPVVKKQVNRLSLSGLETKLGGVEVYKDARPYAIHSLVES